MKRKIKAFLVICCLAIALTLCLTACGNKCEHTYDNSCDAICNDCGETREVSAHDYAAATCTEKAKCTACGTAYGTVDANNHIDENTDHICDRECGKTDIGTHEDKNKDHACDYGCSVAIGTHADTNNDHNCEYGCSTTIGVHSDSENDDDHTCDYGCGATLENCYGGIATCTAKAECTICGNVYGELDPDNHIDSNKDHICDRECGKTDVGTHEDKNNDHNCEYGCTTTIGTHSDSENDDDHTCDYGCGATLENCSGGTATCLGSQCVVCGAWYGDTDATNHANTEEFTYTANDDGTIHTGTYNCCGAEVKIETVIEGSTATITISELPTLLMVRSAIEVFIDDIRSICINGALNETLQGYVAEALYGRTVDLYLPNMETSELSESLTSEEDNISVHCGYIVENGTYLVYNADGLQAWHEAAEAIISTGTEDTNNDWYAEYTTDMPNLTLAADITLTGANNWTPLGYVSEDKHTYYPYIGTIDGNGHTITGLNINSTGDYIAFVGSLGPNSEVKNLTFKDATIIGGENVATVAADCGGNVTNCHVTGSSSVSGNNLVAGVVAWNGAGIISGCTNAAAVTVNVGDVSAGSGGVVGTNILNGIVIGCFNSGDITASASNRSQICGGVVGLNTDESTIIACGNTGKVVSSVDGVGGIAGGNYNVPVYACWTKETTEFKSGTEVSNKDGVGTDLDNTSVLHACYSFADTSAVADAITAMNTAIDEYNASAAEGRKCTYKWQVGTDGYPTLVEID